MNYKRKGRKKKKHVLERRAHIYATWANRDEFQVLFLGAGEERDGPKLKTINNIHARIVLCSARKWKAREKTRNDESSAGDEVDHPSPPTLGITNEWPGARGTGRKSAEERERGSSCPISVRSDDSWMEWIAWIADSSTFASGIHESCELVAYQLRRQNGSTRAEKSTRSVHLYTLQRLGARCDLRRRLWAARLRFQVPTEPSFPAN